jgi:hypothetical protein
MLMAGLMGLVGLVVVIAIFVIISHFDARGFNKRQSREVKLIGYAKIGSLLLRSKLTVRSAV